VPQDGQSYFTVTHIEPYQRNENGIPTNFLEVSYKCFVKPLTVESNQPVLLTGKGTIALGSQ
jgi:hypothetical protein